MKWWSEHPPTGMEHNFRKIATLNQGTPYDYNSVMQYHRWETLTPDLLLVCRIHPWLCLTAVYLFCAKGMPSLRTTSPPWSLSLILMFPLETPRRWAAMTSKGSPSSTSAVSLLCFFFMCNKKTQNVFPTWHWCNPSLCSHCYRGTSVHIRWQRSKRRLYVQQTWTGTVILL